MIVKGQSLLAACAAAGLLFLSGCASAPEEPKDGLAGTRVDASPDNLIAEKENALAEFLVAWERCMNAGATRSAELLIERRPDVALEAIRRRSMPEQTLTALAATYVRATGGAENLNAFRDAEALRAQGAYADAADAAARGGLNHLELLNRLSLIGEIRASNPAEAEKHFRRALELSNTSADTAAVYALLDLRPEIWPEDSIYAAEWQAWRALASHSLARGESWGALLAFRRAEAMAPRGAAIDGLRLGQARSLYALGRLGETLVISDRLTKSTDGPTARSAMALQGVVAADLDRLAHAADSLQQSITGDDSWNGATRAIADLGVVFLRAGDEERGITALDWAAERFDAEKDDESLVRVIANQEAYYSYRGNANLAIESRQKLAKLAEERKVLID